MNAQKVYYLYAGGVCIECVDQESLKSWIAFAIEKGYAPVVSTSLPGAEHA